MAINDSGVIFFTKLPILNIQAVPVTEIVSNFATNVEVRLYTVLIGLLFFQIELNSSFKEKFSSHQE